MRLITIAFDVDGTLIRDEIATLAPNESSQRPKLVVNERIRTLLVTLSSFKNVKIVVWSGGGELYARQVAAAIGIDAYVDQYASKNHLGVVDGVHQFNPDFTPDIAIDDIQACELGTLNLIVREK